MTDAVLGYGTKLLMHDGTTAPLTDLTGYVEIGEIREGPDDDESVNEIEVTSHQSPGRRREYIAGLIDGGQVSITCNYLPDDASQDKATGIQSIYESGEARTFVIVEPGFSQALQFDATVVSRARTRPVDDAMQISFTLRKTGDEIDVTPPS